MAKGNDRIDGWKAIGLYFGRDRSTVIRWARDRGLPIHSIPGGKGRTVYALGSELDAWAKNAQEDPAQAPLANSLTPVGARRAIPLRILVMVATVVFFSMALIAVELSRLRDAGRPAEPPQLPSDAQARALFMKGRDDWALRTSESLKRSIVELTQVTERDPSFAPAFADLADAYLLSQEDGSLGYDQAFERAEQASEHARSLDPALSSAYRALGFIAYWRQGDRVVTGDRFRTSIRLLPNDAQTHFWFANILADNGQDTEAVREFNKARLLDPGSANIAADLAWANWSAGRERDAIAQLTAIVMVHPENAEARSCLAIAHLGAGQFAEYARDVEIRARLRNEQNELERAKGVADSLRNGGPIGMLTFLADSETKAQRTAAFPDHVLAAFYTSQSGDRARLVTILRLADSEGERWGSAGLVRRIALRWRGDQEIEILLKRRAAPRINYGS